MERCCRCEKEGDSWGVWTSDGLYLCSTCAHEIILESEEEDEIK